VEEEKDLTYNAPWVNGGHEFSGRGLHLPIRTWRYLPFQMSGPTGKSNLSSAPAGDNSTSLAAGPSHGQDRLARATCALGARPATHRIVKRIAHRPCPPAFPLRRNNGEGDYILIIMGCSGFGLRLGVFVGMFFDDPIYNGSLVLRSRPSS
jgi:hypothetical protein